MGVVKKSSDCCTTPTISFACPRSSSPTPWQCPSSLVFVLRTISWGRPSLPPLPLHKEEGEYSRYEEDDYATGHDLTRPGMIGDPRLSSTAALLETMEKPKPDSSVMDGGNRQDRWRGHMRALREVLRTCARDGKRRVWPTCTLPVGPTRMKPPPIQPSGSTLSPPRSPSPHPITPNPINQPHQGARAPSAPRSSGPRHGQTREGCEGQAQAPDPAAADGAKVTGIAAGHKVIEAAESPPVDSALRSGQYDDVGRAATGRSSNSSQETRPAQPRRVSFASSEQV